MNGWLKYVFKLELYYIRNMIVIEGNIEYFYEIISINYYLKFDLIIFLNF